MATTDAQILQAVKDAIFALVSTGLAVQEFTIAGRATRRYSLDELRQLEEYYSGKVTVGTRRRFRVADLSGGA